MSSNAVLRFPTAPEPEPEARKTELVFNFRPKPVIFRFTPGEARKLLGTAQRIHAAQEALTEFIDADREEAATSGLETLAVELGAERAAFGYVHDALEEAVAKGESVDLTDQGVLLMRRLEKLIAEAQSNIVRFSPRALSGNHLGHLAMRASSIPAPLPASSDMLLPAAVFFGIVAVVLIVAFSPSRQETY